MTGYLRLEERELTGEEIGDVNKRARERDRNRAQERWGDRGRRQAASRFFSELESKRVTMIKKERTKPATMRIQWAIGLLELNVNVPDY